MKWWSALSSVMISQGSSTRTSTCKVRNILSRHFKPRKISDTHLVTLNIMRILKARRTDRPKEPARSTRFFKEDERISDFDFWNKFNLLLPSNKPRRRRQILQCSRSGWTWTRSRLEGLRRTSWWSSRLWIARGKQTRRNLKANV